MRLNANLLKNVASVNNWEYTSEVYLQEGQINELYFQLIDLDKEYYPGMPIRYVPQGVSVSVEVTFESIDTANVITVNAIQPFAEDKSIWKVSLLATQTPNSGSFKVKLTEDGVDRFFIVKSGIRVDLLNNGGC